jgi:cytidylate kinase
MQPRTKALVVTIDGPAGAGKSTVAKGLALALGYRLLDTGAMYRAVALLARRRGVPWDETETLARMAGALDVTFELDGEVNRVRVAGEDVTAAIREPDISYGASRVSAVPAVRAALLDLQRRLGTEGGVVVEGRDTGTVVFPGADVKFFLTASDDVRARRRHDELVQSGQGGTYEGTLEDMRARDERDTSRPVAPLALAADAVLVDSSSLTLDAVIDTMLDEVRRREREHQTPARRQPRS